MTYEIAERFLYFIRSKTKSYGKTAVFFLFCLLFSFHGFAQKEDEPEDEIPVTIEIKGLGTMEGPAIIHGKEAYLSVTSLFDFIKVRNTPTPAFDSISGFYVNPQDVFVIDKVNNRIIFKDKLYNLPAGDIIRTETNLYLSLKYLQSIFGLSGVFNFRRLWVSIISDVELPVIREMKQDEMRHNMGKLKGDLTADTVIKRSYPLFHLGAADWAVFSTQQSLGASETRANLGLGGVLAGGEANASLNYYSSQPFTEKQQYYQWRFVNNDSRAVRQVVAGKIFTQTISSLYAPLVGVQINNIPTIQRKSYGKYTLSNTTEPGWIVELYINDVLVDYKKSDASGFYSFDVPLIYGYSIIKLRFYGPWGEVRTSQEYISVPFNFLPKGEFEYAATAGVVEDGQNSRFSRISTNYGISNHVTIGVGHEYLSSITTGTQIPFVRSSFRVSSHFLVSGEYAHGVRSRGIINYRLPSNLQFDLDYTKYVKGQTAIFYNYLEDRKASITMPFRGFGTSIFSRLAVNQIILPNSKYTNTELSFSGSVRGLGINLSNYASFAETSSPYIYSIFSFSFMLPKRIFFTSQFQYDFRRGAPDYMKFTFERQLFGKGFVNLTYQEYFNSNNRNVLLGLRYDLSFVRLNISALTGNKNTYSRVESASGSILFDGKTNYINANSRSNVGKGGIVVQPFLDLNCNNIWDDGEPRAAGLKIHVNGGRTVYDADDTTIRVFELEPYSSYYIELDRNSFDNISWQVKKRTIKVVVTPNNFANVQVPVSVLGEVSGVVSLKDKNGKTVKGMGQIIVSIFNSDSVMVARTVTEPDGYFSYLGLAPGVYTVRFDSMQLKKLHIVAAPSEIPIRIQISRDGDVADNLEFYIKSNLPDNIKGQDVSADALKLRAITQPEVDSSKENKLVEEQKHTTSDTTIHIENVTYTAVGKNRVKNYNQPQLPADNNAINGRKASQKENATPPDLRVRKPLSLWERITKFLFGDILEFIANLFK